MSKPNYRVTLNYDPDRKCFIARCPELEHCTAEGANRADAIAGVEEEIDAQLANILSHGSTPPRSVDEEVFSGELPLKLSKLLHRDLTFQARSEGVDVDHLVGELLAAALEARKHSSPRGGARTGNRPSESDNVGNRHDGQRRQGGFGGGGRGNYHQVMDDRANFIEYVRNLEHGQGHGGHGAGRGSNAGAGGGDGRRRRRRGGSNGRPNFQQGPGQGPAQMGAGAPGYSRPQGSGQGINANAGAPAASGDASASASSGASGNSGGGFDDGNSSGS